MNGVTAPAEAPATLQVEDLRFVRGGWQLRVAALRVDPGEAVLLHGPSGSGKSSLLGLIAGTLASTHGRILIAGNPMHGLAARQRDRLRADRIGLIFQQFNLLPFLPLLDNVALPCRFSGARRRAAIAAHGSVRRAAAYLLERLGLDLTELAGRRVLDLSVGQQQRVAAARALIGAPALLLADEPTSALDAVARDRFLTLVMEVCREHGSGLLLVSHDPTLHRCVDRTIALADPPP